MTILENRASQAEESAREARGRAETNRRQASRQWREHLESWREATPPDWLRTPSAETQEIISKELDELHGVGSEYQRLMEVRARFESQAQMLERDERRRAALAVESPVTEDQLALLDSVNEKAKQRLRVEERNRDEISGKTDELKHCLSEADAERSAAENSLSEMDKRLSSLQTSQVQDQQYLSGLRQDLEVEQQRTASRFADLAGRLLVAIEDSTVFEALEELAGQYAEEAEPLHELEEAEAESTRVKAEIELKQRDLDALLEDIGSVTEAEATQSWERLQADASSADEEYAEVHREIGNIERDHERRQALDLKLCNSKREHRAYRTIEEAVYPGTKTRPPGPLFAHITQKLMDSIAQEASRLLDRLGWHIAINYDEKHGFSIQDRALSAVRKYAEFSGGERFAVAIAAALAIGRVTHGAGNIRCLFIDEGFGALDQTHRKRIINDAIGRLIEIGTREQVVVITHLRDMQAYFPNRIELVREVDRSALVSLSEEML